MEVHHHPQLEHKPKPWKEYILEYIMIVLAVTTGFFAETIREGIVHKEKEQQQMESLVNALKSDSAQLQFVIKMNDTIVKSLTNLTGLRKLKDTDSGFLQKFYDYSAVGIINDVYFRTNDAALQEMKSSGIIGALKKRYIADSIFLYQQNNNILQMQEADCYFVFKELYLLFSHNVDFNYFSDTSHVTNIVGEQNVIFFRFKNYRDLTIPSDKTALKNIFSSAGAAKVSNLAYITLLKNQLEYNKRLTALLQKEYDIENK